MVLVLYPYADADICENSHWKDHNSRGREL